MQPSTPNCQQRISSTLFTRWGSRRPFLRGLTVCGFEGDDPVGQARDILRENGLREANECRRLEGLPQGRWMVQVIDGEVDGVGAMRCQRHDPLWRATILGLCGETLYSAERPVIWSKTRLGRNIRLWRLGNFYED